MNKLLLIAFLVFPLISLSQDSYFKIYGVSSTWDGGPSGNFVLQDSSILTTFGLYGFYMMKTDKNGLHQWAKLDSSNRFENKFYGRQIVRCRDEKFLVGGSRTVPASSFSNTSVIKLDTDGNVIWNKTYVNFFYSYNLDTTSDQGFIITGYSHDTTTSFSQTYPAAIRADSLGNVIWCRTYPSDSIQNMEYSIVQTDDGGFLLINPSSSIKIDGAGNVLHSNWFYNYTGWQHKSSIVRINSNAFLALGWNLCLYDSTGERKWKSDTEYKDAMRISDSTFLLLTRGGWIWPGTSIEVMDTSGIISSTIGYELSYQIFPEKFSLMGDGRFVVSGLIDEYQLQYYDLFIMKTMPNGYLGCGDNTFVNQHNFLPDSSAPFVVNSFSLNCSTLEDTIVSILQGLVWQDTLCYQLLRSDDADSHNSILFYPNPATSYFTIYSESQFQNASIKIFNLLGEEVYHVEYKDPLRVDCEHFPRGLYFIKLQTEKGCVVEKLVIQK